MVGVDVYAASIVRPDGSEVEVVVARGMDGRFWMDSSFLGMNRTDLRGMWEHWPGCVQREPRTGRVLVETGAFIAQSSSAERRRDMTHVVNDLRNLLHARYSRS